jgi:enamine deaminase RidA (YjgF/YER057c/UK114 family)
VNAFFNQPLMETPAIIRRWPSSGPGRSRAVAFGNLVWTVANATDTSAPFAEQVAQSLHMLAQHLAAAGSARSHILSLQVILVDMSQREIFDAQWQEWIGPNPAHWPQRACFQSGLAPGLLVELVAVAAPAVALQEAVAAATTPANSASSPPSGKSWS